MKLYFKSGILLCIPMLLNACASNQGDFGFNDVNVEQNHSKAPTFKDAETAPRPTEELSEFMQPSMGVDIPIPRRNDHPQALEEHIKHDPKNIKLLFDSNLEIPHQAELEANAKELGTQVFHSHDGKTLPRKRDELKFTRSGYVYFNDKLHNNSEQKIRYWRNVNGYVFYKGIDPAQAFPNATATYKGTWDFVTDAKRNRDTSNFREGSLPGNRVGAISINESTNVDHPSTVTHMGKPVQVGHSSEFTVDFANKTLKGSLYRNHYVNLSSQDPQEQTKRYSVDAKLHGNRFRGTATAENKQDAYFGQDADLEGGFFGSKAEELAGKFLAKDNSLFGVFAARRDGIQENEQTNQIFDALQIKNESLEKSNSTSFGDARKLIFNGHTFSLLPAENAAAADKKALESINYEVGDKNLKVSVCCSNLDYLKFGSFQLGESTEDKKTATMFLQGERTPVAQLPTDNNVRYQGTWLAHIISKTNHVWSESPNNGTSGSRAEFTVNFADKTVDGKLTAYDRVDPTFTITGKINGNGFSGTANTDSKGFVFDPKSTGAETRVHIKDAVVSGGFYGENANEFGGVFHSNNVGGDRVGGFFGTKKQVSAQ